MTAALILLLIAAGATWGTVLALLVNRREPRPAPQPPQPAARKPWCQPVMGRPPWEIENQMDYGPDATGWKLTVADILGGRA